MRSKVSTYMAVALMATWGFAAQAQQTQPQPQEPSAPGAQPAPPSEAPAAPAERPGASQASEITVAGCIERSGETFTLADAKAPEGATGAAADVEDEYRLVAGSGVNLEPHVDHQVELTGRASDGETPSLAVSAVKMVAATCE